MSDWVVMILGVVGNEDFLVLWVDLGIFVQADLCFGINWQDMIREALIVVDYRMQCSFAIFSLKLLMKLEILLQRMTSWTSNQVRGSNL